MSNYLFNRLIIANYMSCLHRHIDNYKGVNPFWKNIYAPFNNEYKTSYSLLRLFFSPEPVIKKINNVPRTGYLITPASKEEIESAWVSIEQPILKNEGEGKKNFSESTLAAIYLKYAGLLEDAKLYMEKSRILPAYVALRHYVYFRQMQPHVEDIIKRGERLRIFEIGAGGGLLKNMLLEAFGKYVDSYTIVDLPQMLCISSYACTKFYPKEPICIISDKKKFSVNARHIFCPASNIEALKGNEYNLFLNTHSFQEMDDSIIADYFSFIYNSAMPNALFFNSNWEQVKMLRLDGSEYCNSPENYPYRDGDNILFHEEDVFHGYLKRQYGLKSKINTLTSIRIINPTK